jgi:putative hydrolase of the HAD superfamily
LFALDGTLLDRQTCVRNCVADQFDRLAGRLASASREEFIELFLELDQRGYVEKPTVYETMARNLGFPPELSHEFTDDYFAAYSIFSVGFAHLTETLAELQGRALQLAIVTNGRAALQTPAIQRLGIAHFFEAIAISKVEGVAKPDPRILHLTLDRLGVAPSDAVFVGNHPQEDIRGAQQAGLQAIWKRDDYFGPCRFADAVIDELNELPHALDTLRQGRRLYPGR